MTFLIGGKLQATIEAPIPMPTDMLIALLQKWEKWEEQAALGPDSFFAWIDSETKKGDREKQKGAA